MFYIYPFLFILPLLTQNHVISHIHNLAKHLFPSKDMLIEVELQLFISNVDTQLLKWIGTKILKPKNIQNPNSSHNVSPAEDKKVGLQCIVQVTMSATDVPMNPH